MRWLYTTNHVPEGSKYSMGGRGVEANVPNEKPCGEKIILSDNKSNKRLILMNICDLGRYPPLKLSNCGSYHHKIVFFLCSVICNHLLEFARTCLAVLWVRVLLGNWLRRNWEHSVTSLFQATCKQMCYKSLVNVTRCPCQWWCFNFTMPIWRWVQYH